MCRYIRSQGVEWRYEQRWRIVMIELVLKSVASVCERCWMSSTVCMKCSTVWYVDISDMEAYHYGPYSFLTYLIRKDWIRYKYRCTLDILSDSDHFRLLSSRLEYSLFSLSVRVLQCLYLGLRSCIDHVLVMVNKSLWL